MNNRVSIALFALLLGANSLHAAEQILIASQRSNSIEQFTLNGTWVKTFATTGPYAPTSMAQSPLTGEIFVTTMWTSGQQIGQTTDIILRYHANGQFDTNWDTFVISCNGLPCGSPQTESILFDSSGNLWVATAYGEDLGEPIDIFEFLAADLSQPNPQPQPNAIVADMYRGDQMAFNKHGDLCIAGFIDENVNCFNTSTGVLTQSYYAEIHSGSAPVAEPLGLAFDGDNRLYLTSAFTGEVLKEVEPGGPIVLLATLVSSQQLLNGNLELRNGNLYVPSYYYPVPAAVSTPDTIFKVSTSGAVTNFISGGAPPALGNDHLWGAQWVLFYSTTTP